MIRLTHTQYKAKKRACSVVAAGAAASESCCAGGARLPAAQAADDQQITSDDLDLHSETPRHLLGRSKVDVHQKFLVRIHVFSTAPSAKATPPDPGDIIHALVADREQTVQLRDCDSARSNAARAVVVSFDLPPLVLFLLCLA